MAFLFSHSSKETNGEENQSENRMITKLLPSYVIKALKPKNSKLYMTLLLSVTAVLATIAGVNAWIANNRDVNSGGMKADFEVSPNLVISDKIGTEEGQIQYKNLVSETVIVSVDSENIPQLIATTHDWVWDGKTTVTGLIFNTNPTKVDTTTGLRKDEVGTPELTFAAVPVFDPTDTNTLKRYYVDYTVYIASRDKELKAENLFASFESTNESLLDYQMAASVDFYAQVNCEKPEINANTYKGTLNCAGLNCDNSKDLLTQIDLLSTLQGGTTLIDQNSDNSYTIPFNTDGYIAVTMRFYMDGALLKENSDTTTYIRTEGLTVSDLNLRTVFTVIDAEE